MDRITVFLANRRSVAGLLILFIVLGVLGMQVSAIPTEATTAGRIPAPRQGFLAPTFELETLDGELLSLASLRGQVVLVNLWASWCPPCRAEMPAIQALYEEYQDQGFVVLAVNMTFQDSLSAAAAFVQEYGLTFPILLDRSGEVGRLYHMRALPSTFILDREGVIREVVVGGPMSELTLRSMVIDMLGREP